MEILLPHDIEAHVGVGIAADDTVAHDHIVRMHANTRGSGRAPG